MSQYNFSVSAQELIGGLLPNAIKVRKKINVYSKYKLTRYIANNFRLIDYSRSEVYTFKDLNQIFNN